MTLKINKARDSNQALSGSVSQITEFTSKCKHAKIFFACIYPRISNKYGSVTALKQ
jgi:hypothetical protein